MNQTCQDRDSFGQTDHSI